MKYLQRECIHTERAMYQARAHLSRLAYDEWQLSRLQRLDTQLDRFEQARVDYELLKRLYAQTRDRHRALRTQLRQHYYRLLRDHERAPDPAPGIEAKAQALLQAKPFDTSRLQTLLCNCERLNDEERYHSEAFQRAFVELSKLTMESQTLAQTFLQRCQELVGEAKE